VEFHTNPALEITLARNEARAIQRSHPGIFQKIPVSVSDLASALGFSLERRPELRQRARLEILERDGHKVTTIALRDDLDRNVSRFAVAHEIGHAVLFRKHAEAFETWDSHRREVFANLFAGELLTPSEIRSQMAATFRSLPDPPALLKMASRLGLSPRALLTVATLEPSWITGFEKIWLRVKYVENAYTHRDPKLRVVSAHYDRKRFYVATNQSLARFAGNDIWLNSLPVMSLVRHTTNIAIQLRRPPGSEPRFRRMEVCAELSAIRLHPSSAEPSAYFIILVEPQTTAS
jgi:hypothetical protein